MSVYYTAQLHFTGNTILHCDTSHKVFLKRITDSNRLEMSKEDVDVLRENGSNMYQKVKFKSEYKQ